ncbi:MAG: MlaD family protein [Chitinophagaceae bacterium]
MKINNETKIGVLAVVSLGLLIIGFNYLKGKDLLSKSNKLYAVFSTVSGLSNSSPVVVNGLQIGTVEKMIEKDANLDSIIVTINLDKEVNIPLNSVAIINKDLLGTSSLGIVLGSDKKFLENGDHVNTKLTVGLLEDVKSTLAPAIQNVNNTLISLDSLIKVMGGIIDPAMKNNIHSIVSNLEVSSSSLQSLLNAETGMLAKTLRNVNGITGNFAKQNETINKTISNLEVATGKLAAVNLDSTLQNLNNSVTRLNSIIAKADSKEGSLGLLLNDKALYENLENTTRSMNILLDDLRVHPKRYVSISIFGRKNKGNYLTKTLKTDSTAQEKK